MNYRELYNKLAPFKNRLLNIFKIKEEIFLEKEINIKDFKAYSININNPNKPNLVFIHGYGSSTYMYLELFKYLSRDFNIHAIDLAGFGLSSFTLNKETNNIFNSTESCWNYYWEFLEIWINSLKLKDFYLMGHSFGGYLACHYANRNPNNINSIFLLSPAGFNKANDDKYLNLGKDFNNKGYFHKTLKTFLYDLIFEKKINPYKFYYRLFRYLTIKSDLSKMGISEELIDIYYNIKDSNIGSFGLGFSLVSYIFHYGVRSKLPIQDIYENISKKFDIHFYYGDNDYMDKEDTINFCKINNLTINPIIIDNCNHDIHVVNPIGFYKNFKLNYKFNKKK